MATLKKAVLGNPSGSVGHITFSERGKNSVIYPKVERKNILTTPPMLAARDKFKLVMKMALGIIKSSELKSTWPANPGLRHTRLHNVFSANYPLIHTVSNLGKPVLTPGGGFPLVNGAVTLTANGLTFACDAPGFASGIDESVEKLIVGCGIVVLRNPSNPDDPEFDVLRVRTGQISVDIDNPISLSATMDGEDIVKFQAYTEKKVFLVIVTLDAGGNPLRHSIMFLI